MSAMGLTAYAGNIPSAPKLEPKTIPSGKKLENTPSTPNSTVAAGISAESASSMAAATSSSQPSPPLIVGGVSVIGRTPTPAFANRSTGLASSRWATPQTAATSLARPSLNPSSVSISNTSVPRTSTPTLAAQIQGPVISTPAASLTFNTSILPGDSVASLPLALVIRSSPSAITAAVHEPAPAAAIATSPLTSELAKVEPDSRLPAGGTTILSGRNVLIEKTVKASLNDGPAIFVNARLVKTLDSIIRVEIEQNGEVLFQQSMQGNIQYSSSSTMITVFARPDAVKIIFRFPHEAQTFEKFLPSPLKKNAIALESKNASSVPADNKPSTLPETGIAKATHTSSTMSPNKLQTMATDGVLIDITEDGSEEESSLAQGGSALDDLACMNMNKNPVVEEIFDMLNNAADGSFLAQISSNEVSKDAVLFAAEKLVLAFLKNSNIFNLLPEHVSMAYMKNTSKEVLRLAQEQALECKVTETGRNVNGGALASGNNGSQRVNDVQQLINRPQQVNQAQELNHSRQVHDYQQVCKYSVDELVSLRDQASTVKEELILRTEQLKIDGTSPQPSCGSSKTETASTFSSKPYQELCHSSWDLKSATSKVATGESTSEKLQSLLQAKPKVDTTIVRSQHQKTDPELYGTLLSAIGKEPSQTPSVSQLSRSKHCPTPSDVEIRLSQSFSGLKLAATSQPPAKTVAQGTSQTPAVAQPLVKQEDYLMASAQPFAPTQTSQLTADVSRTMLTPMPGTAENKTILEISNKKEDMEKARVPGLSASKWSTNTPSTPVSNFPSLQRIQTPQVYAPVYRTILVPNPNSPNSYRPVTGLEVIRTIPIVAHRLVSAHQLASPPRHQENVPFQTITPFPLRTDMYNHCTSNASSTASDFKSGVPSNHNHTSSPDSARQPLSPRKILQARLDHSLAKRNSSSRG